ncbi:hypothetical protein PRK78_003808 [Emydomyces testavorans]|uniref:Uncharacterized protein n=1 Tax=Emydomyces testavorans TaxID=2070801 RepID=A0AAF0DJX0_9EURO|nr:hypothetical protein PRK78_003808 [Emydomyces testavorans]
MGNKITTVNGVRSPNFFAPGNGVNEVWIGGVEIISRLPFGDSDMAQAGWPKGEYPKIPWHPFIIPLRATFDKTARSLTVPAPEASQPCWRAWLMDTMAKLNWERIFWTVQRLIAVPFLVLAILLYFAPNRFAQAVTVGPFIRNRDVEGVICHPRFKNRAILFRAMLANGFMAQGLLTLCLEVIVKAPGGVPINLISSNSLEYWFYCILAALSIYSAARLAWASNRVQYTPPDNVHESASKSTAQHDQWYRDHEGPGDGNANAESRD